MGELGQNVRILCRITQVIKFWKAVIAWPARVIKEDLGSRWAREISFIMTPLSTAVSTAHTSYSSSILLQVSLWAGCDSQRFMFRDQIPEELVNCVWIGRSAHRSGILSLLYSFQLFLGIWPWKMSCTLSERWWAPCVWGHSSRVSENMAGRFWQHVLPWGWVGWTCRQAPWEGQIPPFPVALGGQEESWGEGSRGRYWPWTTERGAGCREPWDSGGVWAGSLATLLPLDTLFPLGLQEMQFVWRGSRSLLAQQEIFTHVLDGNGFCSWALALGQALFPALSLKHVSPHPHGHPWGDSPSTHLTERTTEV